MSTTSDYLSRKIGDLGCEIAANRNQAKRLDMEHEQMAAELREVEAAYAAVAALDGEEAADAGSADTCGAKSEPFLIRDSDQKPIHYLVKTCRLPAGHSRPHHWPVLTFAVPGFTEEA